MRTFSLLIVSFFLTACGNLAQKSSEISHTRYLQLQQLNHTQAQKLNKQDQTLVEIKQQQEQLQKQVANLHKSILTLTQKVTNQLTRQPAATPKALTQKDQTESIDDREEKLVLGRLEWIWLADSQVYAKARIDTGANISSIDAQDVIEFERDGEKWVRFNTRLGEKSHQIEAPLIKYTRIKQASSKENQRRAVVQLSVSIGSLEGTSEFSLSNRDKMLYPVLIGRNFIQDVAVVDVSKKYIQAKTKSNQTSLTDEINNRSQVTHASP